MSAIRFGSELTFIGPVCETRTRSLPVVRVRWLEDKPRLIGRNGRPRAACTLPGYNAGVTPLNAGKRFPPEPLTDAEVLRLIAAIPTRTPKTGRPDPYGLRNAALVSLLWRTGLRISEGLDLRPHHVDFTAQRVKVLNGKGSKSRTVGIDTGPLMLLQLWLLERATLGVDPLAPLFCTIQRPGRGNAVNSAWVRDWLHELGRRAGIPKRVHPHTFRHSLACSMMREDFTLQEIQVQLGHSSPATTAIYLRGLGADEAFEKVAARRWPGVVTPAVRAELALELVA